MSAKAVYQKQDTFKGWNEDLSEIKSFSDLPKSVRNYARAIENLMPGAKLSYLGVGPRRKDLIVL